MKPLMSVGLALLLAIAVGCGGGEEKKGTDNGDQSASKTPPTTQVNWESPDEGYSVCSFTISGMS